MNRDRRNGKPPIPDNIRSILSIPQKTALKELETFGWVMDYVRRPLFQDPIVILRDPGSDKQCMILNDGTVDHCPTDVAKRSDDET